jgi:hypothetical protein
VTVNPADAPGTVRVWSRNFEFLDLGEVKTLPFVFEETVNLFPR